MRPDGASSAATVRRAAASIRDARRPRQLGLVPGAWPVEPTVADDDATRVQRRSLELGNCHPRVACRLPRDALHEKTRCARRSRGPSGIGRPLATHADVRRPDLDKLPFRIRKIGELVHDQVGPERDDRVTECLTPRTHRNDRLSTERSEGVDLVRRTRHRGNVVPRCGQQRDHVYPDHAARACDEDPHGQDATSGAAATPPSTTQCTRPTSARWPEGAGEGIRTLDPALTRRVL